ncbi:MAG: sugar ABC transporter ATP-binding protein, partial [Mesorhizobium sp.]
MSAAAHVEAPQRPVLEMRHISKTFGPVRALQD